MEIERLAGTLRDHYAGMPCLSLAHSTLSANNTLALSIWFRLEMGNSSEREVRPCSELQKKQDCLSGKLNNLDSTEDQLQKRAFQAYQAKTQEPFQPQNPKQPAPRASLRRDAAGQALFGREADGPVAAASGAAVCGCFCRGQLAVPSGVRPRSQRLSAVFGFFFEATRAAKKLGEGVLVLG